MRKIKYFIEGISEKEWMNNMEKYWVDFEVYSNILPKRFVKEYKKHAFHDYEIISVNFFRKMLSSQTENNIELVIQKFTGISIWDSLNNGYSTSEAFGRRAIDILTFGIGIAFARIILGGFLEAD